MKNNIINTKFIILMTQKHIAFWDNSLSERGSTTALFDYALYNETILNNKSFIFYNQKKQKQWPQHYLQI